MSQLTLSRTYSLTLRVVPQVNTIPLLIPLKAAEFIGI